MKYIIVLASLLFAGCATPGSNQGLTPARVNSIARLAAFGAASGVLVDNPATRPELIKARVIIATLVAGKQWDVVQLAAAFQQAGFKELHGSQGVLIVTGVILAADLTGNTVDLKNSAFAEAAITGALDGLNLALGSQ